MNRNRKELYRLSNLDLREINSALMKIGLRLDNLDGINQAKEMHGQRIINVGDAVQDHDALTIGVARENFDIINASLLHKSHRALQIKEVEELLFLLKRDYMSSEVIIKDANGDRATVTAGGLDVNIQDQTTDAIIIKFNKVTNNTTLSTTASVGDYDIIVTSSTGISVGSYIILFNPTVERAMVAYATGVAGTTITLDTPLDYDFPSGTYVDIATTNLGVNGSTTVQTFGIRGTGAPPGVDLTIDVTRLIFSCTCSSAVDLTKFGNLTRLTNGLVLRSRNGNYKNIFNLKDNAEIAGTMYEFIVFQSSNPAQGVDGFIAQLTFAGSNKIGVAIRLPVGEDLQLLVQDDLSGLINFEVMAEGHIVQ